MNNKVHLITYADRLSGGNLQDLHILLKKNFDGLFGGIHILPFYDPIDGADAGFDPTDHLKVDERLGSWKDISALASDFDIMADLIVNHISSQSNEFKDYLEKSENSPFASLFLDRYQVFGPTDPTSFVDQIYRPRPGLPFTTYQFKDGTKREMWTTK